MGPLLIACKQICQSNADESIANRVIIIGKSCVGIFFYVAGSQTNRNVFNAEIVQIRSE